MAFCSGVFISFESTMERNISKALSRLGGGVQVDFLGQNLMVSESTGESESAKYSLKHRLRSNRQTFFETKTINMGGAQRKF